MTTTLRALLLAAVGALALSACGEAKPAVDQGPAAAVRGREQTPKDVQLRIDQGAKAIDQGDFATALSLLRPIAEQGYAGAQDKLGDMYDAGQGVPENDVEAAKLYRLAADQGLASAQVSLGIKYQLGEGVPENWADAVKWYRLAADQGDRGGQYVLGRMYADGRGVPENYVDAYKWFVLALAQGNGLAEYDRDLLRGKMTPAQIAEAQKLAAEWKPTK